MIQLEVNEENTVLSIQDDGSGLPETLPKNRGIGLRIMAHRSTMIGAVFAARRGETGGTLVTCELRGEAGLTKKSP